MAVDGQRFMTKTQHYRKVTKPLLERKRRARMNLYLDELKDLIVDTMEAQGEHIAKLEKADILELTVNYLRTHKHEIAASVVQQQQNAANASGDTTGINVEKFRAGYTQAAYEVSRVFATVPGLDVKFGTKLMKHLGYQLKDLQQPAAPLTAPNNEEALNLEVVKRTAPTAPTAPTMATTAIGQRLQAEHVRRAYLQQQQQQKQQQQQFQQQLSGGRHAMHQEENENEGGECLWRPW